MLCDPVSSWPGQFFSEEGQRQSPPHPEGGRVTRQRRCTQSTQCQLVHTAGAQRGQYLSLLRLPTQNPAEQGAGTADAYLSQFWRPAAPVRACQRWVLGRPLRLAVASCGPPGCAPAERELQPSSYKDLNPHSRHGGPTPMTPPKGPTLPPPSGGQGFNTGICSGGWGMQAFRP